ncbi:class I SAM-dependent methyltransferase [bacterium]|nr:class I SAM-dependent methyltransferase [candidate division CSSED10-310 bacterium]
MVQARRTETDTGIQGKELVVLFDQMARYLRDRGWIETDAILKSGITGGTCLEIGPGPGYLGLEWLKKTTGTTLCGAEISPDMLALAKKNAAKYGLTDRVDYRAGRAEKLPFEDAMFDGVFSNGSLHEWQDPRTAFMEIRRVLKTDGRYFITDLRRDMGYFVKLFLKIMVKPKAIRPGLLTSIAASYTGRELEELLQGSHLRGADVRTNPIGLRVTGIV